MKFLEDVKVEQPIPPTQQTAGRSFTKTKLINNMTRSKEIMTLAQQWLMSFDGGMTKTAFISQITKLHPEDEKAKEQLLEAAGKRSIKAIKQTVDASPLTQPIITLVANGQLNIAVCNKSKAEIKNYIKECQKFGSIYIIDVDILMGEMQSVKDKGKAPQILKDAVAADFLLILGLDVYKQMGYAPTEHLRQIIKLRNQQGKPTVTDYAPTNTSHKFWKYYYEGFSFYQSSRI